MAPQTHLMEGQLENRAEWGVTPYVLAELLSRTTAVRARPASAPAPALARRWLAR
jgi:hypothetical protein